MDIDVDEFVPIEAVRNPNLFSGNAEQRFILNEFAFKQTFFPVDEEGPRD